MEIWTNLLLFAAIFAPMMYLLYKQGFMTTKSISAILFLFQPGNGGDRAQLDSCTGWVRHVGRFRESRTYTFALDAQLSGGAVEVFLLDRERRQLLRLSPYHPEGQIALDGSGRYYLHWEFRAATGRCELRW